MYYPIFYGRFTYLWNFFKNPFSLNYAIVSNSQQNNFGIILSALYSSLILYRACIIANTFMQTSKIYYTMKLEIFNTLLLWWGDQFYGFIFNTFLNAFLSSIDLINLQLFDTKMNGFSQSFVIFEKSNWSPYKISLKCQTKHFTCCL